MGEGLAGRSPSPASRLLQGVGVFVSEGLAGRTPSPASRLLQRAYYIREIMPADRTPSSKRRPQKAGSYKSRPAHTRFPPLIRPSVSSPAAFDFDLPAPSGGRVEVLRSGQPGMDAGLAAHGQGWPIAAGPRSRTGARERRALARGRTPGRDLLVPFGAFAKRDSP